MHILKHFKTITAHRHRVIVHCAKAGILLQGLFHDLSKYSPSEFFVGAKYYLGNRSPNEGEREAYGYSLAWMHHKGRNRHHFEYWTDYNPEKKVVCPVRMPENYVIEMFCDRVAACKIYRGAEYRDDDALLYFQRGRQRRSIHPETSALLEYLLTMLAEQGEKKTFAYLKHCRRRGISLYDSLPDPTE